MSLPLADIVVLDFGHTVMGPSCGLVLADLGANVIRIEPPGGDPTRTLKGFGTGYFGFFNRNKRSIAIDLKTESGKRVASQLIAKADVLIENFGPGTMERLGFGSDQATKMNPRLIYTSLKGFLKGPYEDRLALDEIVQMMSGLAYMTGPHGRPLRAGTSVIDISGGIFAAIGIMAALRNRDQTGQGAVVDSALFETAVFLMGQRLSYAAQTTSPLEPMPHRVSAWAIYDLFPLRDGRQMFVGITSDAHWRRFCAAARRPDLCDNLDFATNAGRISHRATLIPIIRELFASLDSDETETLCSEARIPFAPVARPEDLLLDRHLEQTGWLVPTRLPGNIEARLPRLPVTLDREPFPMRSDPPAMGQHSEEVLREFGFDDAQIEACLANGTVVGAERQTA